MKATLKSLIYSSLFICLCLTAKAQSPTDTLRININLSALNAIGVFGTAVNTTASTDGHPSPYKYGAGIEFRVDIPLIQHFNITASAGYNTFFKTTTASSSTEGILGVPLPNFQTIPVKLGIKWFLSNKIYLQGEGGETILANKKDLYALYSYSFTYSPQVGLLIPLKKKHTFIDAGFRYENMQNFYYENKRNVFYGLHLGYAFGLK